MYPNCPWARKHEKKKTSWEMKSESIILKVDSQISVPANHYVCRGHFHVFDSCLIAVTLSIHSDEL